MFFDRLRTIPPQRAALILLLGTAFLSAPFMPVWDAARERVALEPRLEFEVLALVGAMALLVLLGRGVPVLLRRIVAALLASAALLHLGAVVVPAVFDRELDLIWDVPELPALLGRIVEGGGWLALAGLILAGIALAAVIAMVLGDMERALRGAGRPQAVLAFAGLGCIVAAISAAGGNSYVPARIAGDAARQANLARANLALLRGGDAPQAPAASDLGKLKHRDLYLVLVDSYATGMLDDARVAAALAIFEKTADESGYYLLSGRLAAPGSEAGAPLAAASLASGLRLDPPRYRMLLGSGRRTLADYLASAGYRTVDVAPSLSRTSLAESSWGFERVIAAADLGSGGAAIPDQVTLDRVLERIDAKPHPPVFVRLELISGRAPADASPDTVAAGLRALATFLSKLKGQPLVIVVGNRAPAAMPEVPIHVLSRDEELVLPFATLGFATGATPPASGAVRGVESFLPDFLRLFASGTSVASLS